MGGRRRRPTANRESPEWRKGAAVVFSGLGRVESKRESGMERERAGDALELEKRGEGACTGSCCGGKVADDRAAGRCGTRARGPRRRS
jgi:hypothetical protein